MKVRLVSSIAVACCVACPWHWLAAEEEIKYPSRDGRFALRIIQPKDDEYHPTVELIEKDSGKLILMLHDGSDTDLFDPSECVLVWAADSKRLAYGFRANPPGARDGWARSTRPPATTFRRNTIWCIRTTSGRYSGRSRRSCSSPVGPR